MTVEQLISHLQNLPQKANVILQGCDCYNAWNGEIEVDECGITLKIGRDEY